MAESRSNESASAFSGPMRRVVTGAEAVSPTGSPARSFARRSRHQRSWSGLPFESSPFSWSGRRFDSPQPSRSGVLTSRLYELTLDAPANQELLIVPAKSSKKTARALKVVGDPEISKDPPSPGWAELKAQCERMEKEDRRITSIDLTHIPESDTEADNHGLHGSRRRRGKDADGVVMYGLGWQPSRDVERSNGPDHEVEIELLPQRSEPKEGGGGLKEGVKHARKSHRRQQSCPTDYCLVEQTERADRTQRERVERVERTERDQGTEEQWFTQGSLPAGQLAGSSGAQWEGACMQEHQQQQLQQQQQQLQQVDVENRNNYSEGSAWQEGELSQVRGQQERRGKLSLFATWHSRTRSRAEEFQSAVMSLSASPPPPSSLPSSPPPAFSFPSPSPQSPSSRPASRHRRCSSGVLQPTYSLSDQQPLNALTAQQPSCTPTGFGYDCGEGERIAGTQSSRGRTSPGVQQEARVLNPLGSRLNPHFKPCQPGPPPQQGASDDPAASASLSESPHRLQPPPHEEQPPCQPCLAPPGQGWPGQGPFGEGAFEQVSFRFKAPPGNAPERWQQVMEERVREAFAMGYLAGLRDAAAHSVAPPAAALAAVAAAGASPGRFVPKKISSDSHYVTSQWRERAAPPRMCKSSTVSGISHCQDRSPLRWTREVRMPQESIHQSSTVSGGGSHSNGNSPLGWTGEGEVQMPQGSHARLKGPLQARRVASGPLQPRSGPLQPRHGLLEPQFGPLQPWAGLLQPRSDVLQPRSGPLQSRTDLQQSQQPPLEQPNRENCRLNASRGDSAGCTSVHAEGTRSARIPLNQLQPQQEQPQQQQVGEQQQQQAQVEGEQQQQQKQQAVEQEEEQQEEGWRQRRRQVRHRRSGSLGACQELPCRAGEEEGSVRALAFHSAAGFERSFSDNTEAGPGVGAGAGEVGVRVRVRVGVGAGMEGQAAEQTTTASAASSAAAAAASCPAAAVAAAAAASCPAAAAARDVMGVCSDVESDADSCQSPGGGGNVGGVHTGASCTGLRLSRRLFSGRLLLTRDSS